MYVQGVSTRPVAPIAQELCGFDLSSTQVSRVAMILDEELEKFRKRALGHIIYIYLDEDLMCRGLKGIELVISDDHSGLKAALRAVLPSVPWQRCLFHLAQNAQAYAPSVPMRGEIAQMVRDIFQALDRPEAERRVKEALQKYEKRAPKFCSWLEENALEGMTYYSCPRAHWKKIRTVNVVERLNEEVKRRTRVARLFANEASCMRLVTAVVAEMKDGGISGKRDLAVE